jgi:phosphoribosylglycinamide formyltransferase 1
MTKLTKKLRLAVLISGTGRTLRNFQERILKQELSAEIAVVISSTANAHGLQFAETASPPLPIRIIERTDYSTREDFSQVIFDACREADIDYIVLAGFIRRLAIPSDFDNRVLSIHPSLIPAFCGKGFYGQHVHEAAIEYGVKLSGCTVHFLDDDYDKGPVILQSACDVDPDETPDSLNDKVFELEKIAYPQAIQLLAEGRVQVLDRRVLIHPLCGKKDT